MTVATKLASQPRSVTDADAVRPSAAAAARADDRPPAAEVLGSRRRRLPPVALSAVSLLIYALLMPWLFQVFGPGVESVAVVAVVFGAAGFGMRGGLVMALLLVAYHVAAYLWLLDQPLATALHSGSLPANLVLPLIGVVVGRLRDLQQLLNTEMTDAAATRSALQRTSVEANAANQAKSDFLARMSHEIRTPMHGVIGMSQLLLESRLAERQREYAEMIRSSANALLLIVNDILDFSKVEAGRLSLDPVDFELTAVIEEVANLMRVQAKSKGLALVLLSAPTVPEHVYGDPGRLRQILINLLGNALKFTAEGEVLLELTVLAQPEADAEVRFTVRDSGIGMTPDQASRIFEPFQQADGSSTRHYGGTGLGLTISQELVELMGGTITVTATPGQGSAFSFAVHFAKVAPPVLPVLPDLPRGLEAIGQLKGVRTALVCEGESGDNTLTLRLISLGLRVERYDGMDRALTVLRADAKGPDPVRLCVLDVLQVDEPALDLARLLTSDPDLAAVVPVLVAVETAGTSSRDVENAGFAAFLERPLDQSLLGEGLRAALGLGAVGRSTRKRTLMVTRHSVIAQKQLERPRVLLAEDNRINQVIAVKLLERQGMRVDVVGDGRQAVEASAQRRYAAIFMDCLMPEMDGFEATRQIRAREAQTGAAPVPIIAMTASAMEGDRERTEQAGMNDFLAKPVEGNTLEEALTRWLPGRRALLSRSRISSHRRTDLPVDVTVLGNLKRAGGPEVVRVAIDLFLEAGNESIVEIEDALAAGDAAQIRMVVHRFKGSCGSVGARAMALICGRMEQASGAGPLVLDGELESLRDEFRRVEQALRAYRTAGSSAFEPMDVG